MKICHFANKVLAIATLAISAHAQTDDGPIRVILPFGPGSGTDNIARPLLDAMSREMKLPVVVDNRPGASGSIAASAAARSAPDGKTLFLTTNTTQAINQVLFKKLPYDPVRDFTPVVSISTSPYLLLVPSDLPVSNLNDLVAWIKANPGKASYGWGAAVSQIAGANFLKQLGLSAVGVPYKSSPQAVTDLTAGRLTFMFLDLAAATPIVSGNRLKSILVTSAQRLSQMPAVPTAQEAGLKDFEVAAWVGIFAPAGTADAKLQAIASAVKQAMSNPELLKRYEACCVPMVLSGDAFADYVKKDRLLWSERAAAAGIQPE